MKSEKSDLRTAWALLSPYVRPRVPMLILVSVFGAISAAAQSAVLFLFVPVWDIGLFPAEEGDTAVGGPIWITEVFLSLGERAVEAGWFTDARAAVLAIVVGVALTLGVVAAAAQYAFTWFARLVAYQMIVDLRVDLARHLMGLSVRYHGERKFGDLLSRVSSDVTTTLGAINVGFKSLIQQPFFALGTLIAAGFAAFLPTVGMLFLLLLTAWPISRLMKRVRKGSKKSLTTLGASVQALTQMFQGIRTVKSFAGEEREIGQYRAINESYLKTSMKMVRAIALSHAWTTLYSVVGVALLVGVFGYLILRFDVFPTGGSMVLFFMAIARFNNHVKNFTKALTRVQESVGASARIHELLEEPAEVVEKPSAEPIAGIGAGVRFENVTLRYPDAHADALADLTLDVQPGETLALVGPSGAGKSTVVDLVARFIDPSAGRITVDGKDLRDVSLSDWTSLYAMVGQVPFLFHASIGENIRYGRPDASQAEVEAAAADIHDFVQSLPNGYDTDVADMGARLSGGQRQRITIARAILKGAPLLLLDEATSALDSESEVEVQRALERLMEHRTVIVIAHRLSTIRDADRIAVLEDGRLVELGSHGALVAQKGAYERLYALQGLARSGVPSDK